MPLPALLAIAVFFGSLLGVGVGGQVASENVPVVAQAEESKISSAEEVRRLREENADLKRQLQELTRVSGEMQQEIADLKTERDKFLGEVVNLIAMVGAGEAKERKLQEGVGDLEQWKDEALGYISSLQQTLALRQFELEKRDSLVRLGMESAKKLLEAQATIRRLRTRVDSLVASEAKLQGLLYEVNGEKGDLERKLRENETKLAETNGKLGTAETKRNRLGVYLAGAIVLVFALAIGLVCLVLRNRLCADVGGQIPGVHDHQ